MIDKNKFEYLFFALCIKLFKLLGLSKTRKFGKFAGTFIYYFIPIRKKVVIANLSKAFPQKQPDEIKKIALHNYQSIAITFFEFMYLPSSSTEEIKSMLEIYESENAHALLTQGKGFIFLTAHFGNWELGATAFSVKYGLKFHIMAQPQRNPYVTEWLTGAREAFGNKVIYLGVSIRRLIEALKNNGVVAIAGDQRGHVDSPRIDFFGVPTAYHAGTPTIILKTNSSVLIGFCTRQDDYSYKMRLEELDLDNLPDENDAQITEVLRRYVKMLEMNVRQHPEQYFWMHKIWKY